MQHSLFAFAGLICILKPYKMAPIYYSSYPGLYADLRFRTQRFLTRSYRRARATTNLPSFMDHESWSASREADLWAGSLAHAQK